jgi:3-phosphoshikimate 1-carboxyvinyltransferase
LGADIQYTGEVGYPPLQIIGRKLKGGHILINATESSQFISALLMIAPLINGGVRISFNGPISSRPYIEMTISLMKYFGAKVIWDSSGISVEEGTYKSVPIQIENDWSSASFWFAMAALADAAEIRMQNINFNSIQGDVIVSELFKNFGVNSVQVDRDVILNKVLDFKLPDYFEYNFTSCPDLVIPVGFVCAALKIKAHFTGVKNLRIKESDRLTALKNEIIKLGASASIHNDSFTIDNFQKPADEIIFISYDDHRMVMAEAVTSVFFNQISIDNHVPVSKSYPEFWDQLRRSGFETSIT